MDAAARRPYHAMMKPARKSLPHENPLWIDPAKENYFITICCHPRRGNQLARPETANGIFETIIHRNEIGVWFVQLAVLMPDHLHFLVSFPETGKRMQTIVNKWKEWTAKTLGIRWQRDFFEHRLRREESAREKADYILENPVRAGLVSRWEDWPYVFIAEW